MHPIVKLRARARWLSKQQNIKQKDALQLVAEQNGYRDWKACKDANDTYWYPKHSAFLNHWFTIHTEAKSLREKDGGYLLTYKGQYFVASADYIRHLGFDPNDPVWRTVHYDVSSANALEKFFAYYGKSDSRAKS